MRGTLVRLPLSSRPWRAVVYVVARLPLPALAASLALLPLNRGWTGAAIAVGLLLAYVVAGIAFAPAERRLVTVLGRAAVADPHSDRTLPRRFATRPPPGRPGTRCSPPRSPRS